MTKQKPNDALAIELSAMRRCASILGDLPSPARSRVMLWLRDRASMEQMSALAADKPMMDPSVKYGRSGFAMTGAAEAAEASPSTSHRT